MDNKNNKKFVIFFEQIDNVFVNSSIYDTMIMLGCVHMKQKWLKYSSFFLAIYFMIGNVYAIEEETVNCGADIIGIPVSAIRILHNAYVVLQIGAPLILVVMGILDFSRAVLGNSEDDIKKKQHKFIKRVVAAIMVFLVLAIVRWIFGIMASAGFIDARGCINLIVNGVKK